MKPRLGLAIAVNLLAFVALSIAAILLHSRPVSSAVQVFLDVPAAEARIFTRIISPDIVPAVLMRDNHLRVTGVIQCTEGMTLELRATVTQGTTTARGTTQYTCTGHPQRWILRMAAGNGAFETGVAEVHVWSSTLEDEEVHEWDRVVRIVGPE